MGVDPARLERLVADALDRFYARRTAKLQDLELKKTLKRKNPYLFRAIGVQNAGEFVEKLLSAFMSSSEEGIFGDEFFEPLAKAVSGGNASPTEGVDVVVDTSKRYLAVAVKSGPSVFNAQSKRRQNQEFQALRSRMMKLQKHFEAMVGYCYGQKVSGPNANKIYRELAGQAFWAELTGDEDFYLKIVDAMKKKPSEHKEVFMKEWNKAVNRFLKEFTAEYCTQSGEIDWLKIVLLNSGRRMTGGKKSGG